jgi:hypothetical protein
LEYDPEHGNVHPIHKDWTEEQVSFFKMRRGSKTYLPIVPDLYLMKEVFDTGAEKDKYQHKVKDHPIYDPAQLFAIREQFEARAEMILDIAAIQVMFVSSNLALFRTNQMVFRRLIIAAMIVTLL